ncbi:hypothetical protein N2152v2_003915 [Parachlorella kessleri]
MEEPQLRQEDPQAVAVVSRQRGKRGCQVCGAIEKEVRYYKRFHICRKHANLPSLELGGRLVRFCQQCGRFHDVSAFDGESQPWEGPARTKRQASDASTLSGMAPYMLPLAAELPSPAPAVPGDSELAHQAQQLQQEHRQPQQGHLQMQGETAPDRLVTSMGGQAGLPVASLPSYIIPPLPDSLQPGKLPASPAAVAMDWRQQACPGQPQQAQRLQRPSAQPPSLGSLPAVPAAAVVTAVPCRATRGRLSAVQHSADSMQLAPSPCSQGLTSEEQFKLVQRLSDLEWLAWDQGALLAPDDGAGFNPDTLPQGDSEGAQAHQQRRQQGPNATLQQQQQQLGTPAASTSRLLGWGSKFVGLPFPGSLALPVAGSASASPAAAPARSPQAGGKGLLPLSPAAPCWPSPAPSPQPPVQQPTAKEWLQAVQGASGRRHAPPCHHHASPQPLPSLDGKARGQSVTPSPPPAFTTCQTATTEPPKPSAAPGWLLPCPPPAGPKGDCQGLVEVSPTPASSLNAARSLPAVPAASGASPFQEELLEAASVLLFQATPEELAPHVRAGFTLLLHKHPGLLDDILSGEADFPGPDQWPGS